MMSFSLSGGVEVFGFISPSEPTDTYPVIDPIYGIDGLRNVNTISDLDNIPDLRRRAGMVVGVSGGTEYYKLNPSPWNFDFTDWSVFNSGIDYLPLSGGTVTGSTIFTQGLTANTISATTYDNLPITGATSVGTGLTIFDSVVDRTIQINTITGDDLGKILATTTNNTIQVGINEENLDLWPLVVQGNRLLSGGVSYVSGLTFNVSPVQYIIDGSIYTIQSSTTVVLNSGDTLYDRIDVIVADISGNTLVVQGIPSTNPEKPDIDESIEVEVTFVIVRANSVTADIDGFIIYNENLGPPTEWTFGVGGTQSSRIIGSSTGQTYSGTTSIRVSGVTALNYNTYFRLTGNTEVDTNNYATLQFALKNLSANTTTNRVRIRFLTTGGTQNGSVVYMNAAGTSGYVQYSSTNTSTWQLISIPLWRFYLTNTNVQVVEVSFSPLGGGVTSNYYFDLIGFVEGAASSPPSNSWTTIKGDSTTTIIAPNPNATLTISGGTNISSSISGSSTVVLNLDNNISLNSVSATTISATTYQNLPKDIFVTGGTYNNSNGTSTFTNNSGGTFNVTGYSTGASLPYSNVIFVDGINGNDSTAITGRFDKPCQTVSQASTMANLITKSSTDKALIYIRKGTYSFNGSLQNYLDYYCEAGVTFTSGSVSDQTYGAVVSNFYGYAVFQNTDVFITQASSVNFEFDYMSNVGSAFIIIPASGLATVNIKANYIYTSTSGTGYGSTIRNNSNVVFNVSRGIESVHSTIDIRNHSGDIVINCPKIYLSTGNIYGGNFKQGLILYSTNSDSKVIINGDIVNKDTIYYGGTSGMVTFWGGVQGSVVINGDIVGNGTFGTFLNGGSSNGKLVVNGGVSSNLMPIYAYGAGNYYFKNGTIYNTNTYGGYDGSPAATIFGTCYIYFNNVNFYNGADITSSMDINSTTCYVYVYNSLASGNGLIGYFMYTGTAGITVQIHNVRSTKTLHPNVIDGLTPTGLIVDTALKTPIF
jgi:hypothetical protein